MVRKKLITALGIVTILVLAGLATLLALRDQEAEKMETAYSLRESGEIEKAADLFGQIPLTSPDSKHADDALFEVGFTYYVVGLPGASDEDKGLMLEMARDAFWRLINGYPHSPFMQRSRLYLAEIFTAIGEEDKALEQYELISISAEDDSLRQQVLYKLVEGYEREDNVDMAVERLVDIININLPGRYYENAHLTLARYYRLAGVYEQVVAILSSLLNSPDISYSTRQNALLTLTYSLLELKRFGEATKALERVEITRSNKTLVDDYSDRIRRRSMNITN